MCALFFIRVKDDGQGVPLPARLHAANAAACVECGDEYPREQLTVGLARGWPRLSRAHRCTRSTCRFATCATPTSLASPGALGWFGLVYPGLHRRVVLLRIRFSVLFDRLTFRSSVLGTYPAVAFALLWSDPVYLNFDESTITTASASRSFRDEFAALNRVEIAPEAVRKP